MQNINYTFNANTLPIFELVKNGELSKIKAIRMDFSSLETLDHTGRSPLRLAHENGHQAILDYFFTLAENYFTTDNQIDINKLDPKGRSIMHWAAKCNQNNTVINKLNSIGADIDDARNQFKVTPLYMTAQDSCAIAAAALIEAGANIHAEAINGAAPIHAVAENGNVELLNLLIKANAKTNHACHQGGTPLFIAAQKGHLSVVKKLLASGSEVNFQTPDGATALLVASQNGFIDIARELIAAGANVNLTLKNGVSPLYAANANQHSAIAELLISAGAT